MPKRELFCFINVPIYKRKYDMEHIYIYGSDHSCPTFSTSECPKMVSDAKKNPLKPILIDFFQNVEKLVNFRPSVHSQKEQLLDTI